MPLVTHHLAPLKLASARPTLDVNSPNRIQPARTLGVWRRMRGVTAANRERLPCAPDSPVFRITRLQHRLRRRQQTTRDNPIPPPREARYRALLRVTHPTAPDRASLVADADSQHRGIRAQPGRRRTVRPGCRSPPLSGRHRRRNRRPTTSRLAPVDRIYAPRARAPLNTSCFTLCLFLLLAVGEPRRQAQSGH